MTLVSDKKTWDERSRELFKDFQDFVSFLRKAELEPDIVYIEQAIYRQNIKTTLTIDSVINAAKYTCVLNELAYKIIDNRSWKKGILGKGNAKKEEIRNFADSKWGDVINSQDLADAACIALYGLREKMNGKLE